MDALEAESRRISRYLLDVDPGPDLIERYRSAHAVLLSAPPSPRDRALLDLVSRHPGLLPFLDAGCGLLRRESLLRRKVLLMLAILETSPKLASRFEPESMSRTRLGLRLGGLGVVSVARTAAGVALWPLVLIRSRRPRPSGA